MKIPLEFRLGGNPLKIVDQIIPRGLQYDSDEMDNILVFYVDIVDQFYEDNYNSIGYSSYALPREMLRNACAHGDVEEKGLHFAYFLFDRSIVIACNDYGPYFKQSQIKKKWENKIPIESKHKDADNKSISGNNLGTSAFIYGLSSKIVVQNGTLFVKYEISK